MKLVLIYGSPAVGKLTVAREIARRTDCRVFHNHLSIDCLVPVFDFGTPSFTRLVELIRLETIREAARVGQNLIYTFCYAKGLDDAHVERVAAAVEDFGGELCPVLLVAEKETIERRVAENSRAAFGKIRSVETLRGFFATYEMFSPFPRRESLVVDNTHLTAGETAALVIDRYALAGGPP